MGISKKNVKTCLLWLSMLAAVIIVGCAAYLSDYYRADLDRIEAFLPEHRTNRYEIEKQHLAFAPESPDTGFIFYPGGKVEYTAYIPLMEHLASEGVLCVLVKMPGHLAVLDRDAAQSLPKQFPEIKHWYIGGHSLGGAMAASYLSTCTDTFEGLILLGAYSTANLSETNLSVLSIYGSEDQIMDRNAYEANKENLPKAFREIIIDGGCHAYFGMYGTQDGDGTPTIDNETQIVLTAEAILSMVRPPEKTA